MQEKNRRGYFRPVKLKRHIDFATLSRLEEHRLELPGIIYDTEPRRYYPTEIRASHIFGYLGEVEAKEIQDADKKLYRAGDVIGKKGW